MRLKILLKALDYGDITCNSIRVRATVMLPLGETPEVLDIAEQLPYWSRIPGSTKKEQEFVSLKRSP